MKTSHVLNLGHFIRILSLQFMSEERRQTKLSSITIPSKKERKKKKGLVLERQSLNKFASKIQEQQPTNVKEAFNFHELFIGFNNSKTLNPSILTALFTSSLHLK